jgi:hypothetical protein
MRVRMLIKIKYALPGLNASSFFMSINDHRFKMAIVKYMIYKGRFKVKYRISIMTARVTITILEMLK